MMRYPISVQTFELIINGGYVYADKTDLVYDLAQEHVCFLSRPRRFGKSLLVSTLEAYFTGRKELFKGLKIDSLEEKWEQYPIFRIDFADGNYNEPETLLNKLEGYVASWESLYGKTEFFNSLSDRFKYVLEAAEKKTGHKAVVLIDEYDKPMLDVLGTEIEEKNRNILKGFYGTFKAADANLRFVFLTGVTKFSQISVFSGFNQPNDISMDSKFDAVCGITEEELYSYFAEPIKKMAEELDYTEDEMKAVLKKKYDGYHFSRKMLDIYNPFSLLNAFNKTEIDDYWYKSGTPAYLAKLLEGHKVNMQKLTENLYKTQYFVDYRADKENPLAMLYQSGYLTIKECDKRNGLYRLDYPNDEVKSGFVTLISNSFFRKEEEKTDNWIYSLSEMLRTGDLEGVRDAYTSFLASIPYEANKDERAKDFETHFSYTFYLINRMLSCYTTLIEKQNSKGRADVIIETDDDIFIFEFKLDGSAEEALKQIDEKQYALPYLNDSRKLHKIGVNISSESRTVEKWLVSE
ncbi:ATP-binding protein [Ruminococcus sp. HUN007]|uniref:ATP-binding protein n=1 Tax=Ruminococcus sp. HUN007 TaxID=1514668 RepID=UPI000A74AD3E|nr:ATP-binding protein [Ruminococcus sp. HUN007]